MNKLIFMVKKNRALFLICFVVAPLLIFVVIQAHYHPFFLGDELIAFQAQVDAPGFFDGFMKMNEYKPRLVHHALLSFLIATGAPRWTWAAVYGVVLVLVFFFLIRLLEINVRGRHGVLLALLALLVLVTSRYFFSYYYEYANALIDSVAIMFFLAALSCLLRYRRDGTDIPLRSYAFILAMLVLSALNHERYSVIGFAVLFVGGFFELRKRRMWAFFTQTAVGIIPVMIVFALGAIVSRNSISMGTAGQDVAFSAHVVVNAVKYAVNLFAGTSFGPDWFWGSIRLDWLAYFASIAMVSATCVISLVSVRKRKRLGGSGFMGTDCALLAGIVAAICVMSLPAPDRMEMRWATIPSLLLLVLIVRNVGAPKRAVVFVLLILAGLLSFAKDAYFKNNYLVASSRCAEKFGNLLNAVEMDVSRLYVKAGPDAAWMYLGSSPRLYIKANGRALMANKRLETVHSEGSADQILLDRDSARLSLVLQDRNNAPIFDLERPAAVSGLKTAPEILGTESVWSNWIMSRGVTLSGDGVLLPSGCDGYVQLSAERLRKKYLTYEVSGRIGAQVRWQINWHDRGGAFIEAAIDVITLDAPVKVYRKKIVPPGNAATGYVYISRHGDSQGDVLFRKVVLCNE